MCVGIIVDVRVIWDNYINDDSLLSLLLMEGVRLLNGLLCLLITLYFGLLESEGFWVFAPVPTSLIGFNAVLGGQ